MSPPPCDFSIEVIPSLIGQIQTWHTDKGYMDIGTPSALAKAQDLFCLYRNDFRKFHRHHVY